VTRNRLFGGVFLTLLLAAAGSGQITVNGTDTYPADVAAIQAAVSVPNTTVYLSGTFNFGEYGQILITVPGITLEGMESGATIKGGWLPITTLGQPFIPPSSAKNVTIRNIHFEGWRMWAIYHDGVQAEDNFTLIEGNTFTNTKWPASAYGWGILYAEGGGSAEIKNNTLIDIRQGPIFAVFLTVHADDHLLISDNKIMKSHYEAIIAELWNSFAGDPDNGPVIIKNNEISMGPDLLSIWTCAIDLGNAYGLGVSNAVIEGNVITGYAGNGIGVLWYGHNRKIINNDLSGLTTWMAQIATRGREDLIANNVLGPVDEEFAALMGFPYLANGITILANKPPGQFAVPLPVTNNVSTDNDFRLTGLNGWAYDAAGNFSSSGCVMLISGQDIGWPGPSIEVTDNLVNETGRFPVGTGGPRQQVLEFPVMAHHNRIIGHAADEYAQLEAANPGLGQKIKESMAKFMEMQLNRQAFDKELMKEIEER
jgi:Right handed beta helix region